MSLTIGITDTSSRYENYPAWIKGGRTDIEIIRLSHSENNAHEVDKCHGIVFSGGVDIHPKWYGRSDISYPGSPDSFDVRRDEFELEVLRRVRILNLPILGICRGMQLINVALGGSLFLDLETMGKNDHTRHGLTDGIHDITVVKNSLLFSVTRELQGMVNSAHHQALNKVAPILRITALSEDHVAEAAEFKEPGGKPWMLLVQWHPERLCNTHPGNPLEADVRKAFLNATEKNQK
jgi:putative glutamine amidotransferase